MSGVLNAVLVDRYYYLPKNAFSFVVGQFLDVENVDRCAIFGNALAQGGDVERLTYEPPLLFGKQEGMHGVNEFSMVTGG